MAGRFTARRLAAEPAPVPAPEPSLVAPIETVPARAPVMSFMPAPDPVRALAEPANPLHSDKYLDAKVRLHKRLIEEVNLSALEKLPEDEMRAQVQQLVTQYTVN